MSQNNLENDVINVLVIGKGQLATVLMNYLPTIGNFNVEQCVELLTPQNYYLYKTNYDLYINCVAKSNTRECENNWNGTYFSNAIFPILLAENIRTRCLSYKDSKLFNDENNINIKIPTLIHISTGCIFDGNITPHYEDDVPTPLINYSKQKHVAELCLLIYSNTIIVRPRMLFSDLNIKSNLLHKIAGFNELIQEQNSMTCCYDLVDVIVKLYKNKATGIFNVCNENMSNPFLIKCNMLGQYYNCLSDNFGIISKKELYNRTKINLTNTWVKSNKLKEYDIKLPDVNIRLNDMIEKSLWIKDVWKK